MLPSSLDVIRVLFKEHRIPLLFDLEGPGEKLLWKHEKCPVVLYYEGHFILGVAVQASRTLEVYDSRRNYMKDARGVATDAVKRWLHQVWSKKTGSKRRVGQVLKEAGVQAQQNDAPGDSAIFVINHALLATTKVIGKYDRKSLRAVVKLYD